MLTVIRYQFIFLLMEPEVYKQYACNEDDYWWFKGRRAYLEQVILQYVGQRNNLKICEVGCGSGGNLTMLAHHGIVDAVEMESYAQQYALSREITNVSKVLVGYLPDNIPLVGPYEVVCCFDVIEHVEDDLDAIAALKQLVKPAGGVLVVTVPAYQWMWSSHDVANQHFRRYTIRRVRYLMESVGFKVCYSSYFNTLLFPLAVLSKSLEWINVKKTKKTEWAVKMPRSWINNLLQWIFGLERYWAGKISIPFGLSIVVVAR